VAGGVPFDLPGNVFGEILGQGRDDRCYGRNVGRQAADSRYEVSLPETCPGVRARGRSPTVTSPAAGQRRHLPPSRRSDRLPKVRLLRVTNAPERVLRGPAVSLVFGSGAVQAGSGSGWSRFFPSSLASAAGGRIRHASVTGSLSCWKGRPNDLSRCALAAAVQWLAALGPEVCCA
jgi:hypothetical protein